MNLKQKLSLPSYIMFQEFDNEGVLLDIRTQEHFGLDSIGSLFFSNLNSGKSVEEIFNIIHNIYDVQPAQLEKDLDTLMQQLLSHNLIEVN